MTARRVLNSSDKTTFECVSTFQGSTACVQRSFHDDLFLTCFDRIRNSKVPFEVSLAGKICEIGSQHRTREGIPMIEFSLQDVTGLYVQCVAHGRHAESGVIQKDHEIIVFFGSAKSGLDNTAGRIWFYAESHILCRDEKHVWCEVDEEIIF